MVGSLTSFREQVNQWLWQYQHTSEKEVEERASLEKTQLRLQNIQTAQELLQLVAQGVQQEVYQHIATIVTRCLEAVFDCPYEFSIQFERKRGKTEAQLLFLNQKGEELSPRDAVGGGVLDVAAFALRLACLLLTHPPQRPVLILDEPFRFVSVNYRQRVADMLRELSEEMKLQIVLVSHSPHFHIGHVIPISS